eukprot:12058463-Prorocentrum_lima.AAC.1
MTSSLVGSEMCIRDSLWVAPTHSHGSACANRSCTTCRTDTPKTFAVKACCCCCQPTTANRATGGE